MARFNPSPNVYTDKLIGILGQVAMDEIQSKGKVKRAKELLQQFQKHRGGGLMDEGSYVKGYDIESGLPEIGFMSPKELLEYNQMRDLLDQGAGGPDPVPQTEPMMTLASGELGDISEKPVSFIKPRKGKKDGGLTLGGRGARPKSMKVGGVTYEFDDPKDLEKKELARDQVVGTAKDTLFAISEVKKGLKYFGAAGVIPPWPAEYNKINWKANLDQLKSKLILGVMNSMKQASRTGATGFGQLSEKELEQLQNAATALRENMSEEDALKQIGIIESKTKKILQREGEDQTTNNDPLGIR